MSAPSTPNTPSADLVLEQFVRRGGNELIQSCTLRHSLEKLGFSFTGVGWQDRLQALEDACCRLEDEGLLESRMLGQDLYFQQRHFRLTSRGRAQAAAQVAVGAGQPGRRRRLSPLAQSA